MSGVYYDQRRRKWMYAPEPFDADDCRNVAGMLGRDGWAADLLRAADEIEQHESDDDSEPRIGLFITVSEGRREA